MESTIHQQQADAWLLTETHAQQGPNPSITTHRVDAGPDWGYRLDDTDKRKVLLHSANPWRGAQVSTGRRDRAPTQAVDALSTALAGFTVTTVGQHPDLLDHIAHSGDMHACGTVCWPGTIDDRRLTDHLGTATLLCRLSLH
jgi:hypothetical protein